MKLTRHWRIAAGLMLALILTASAARAQENPAYPLPYPPAFPAGQEVLTDRSDQMLRPTTDTIRRGVRIAQTAPEIDVLFYPGQNYAGDPWSNWGDSLYANGKFYSSVGDHLSPRGRAIVVEYDPQTKQIRIIADIAHFLETGEPTPPSSPRRIRKGEPVQRGPNSHLHENENYTPGKVHGRLDMGSDGWLYYSTHRGSARTTNDAHGYRGDWIFRTHPETAVTEIVAAYPLAKHCMPASVLDPQRMIFYAGTAEGADAEAKGVHFLAYDIQNGRVLKAEAGGFKRYSIFDPDSGKVFWEGRVYDPATNTISPADIPDVRAATGVTAEGWVYAVSDRSNDIWGFNVRTGERRAIGNGIVGSQTYITSMEVDPTGRYVYYIPGAHGGGPRDGTPVVQFDVQTGTPKVIAFLHPYYQERYQYTLEGTFGVALDDAGEKLFIAWNGKRDGQPRAWESCVAMVVHIPESERQP